MPDYHAVQYDAATIRRLFSLRSKSAAALSLYLSAGGDYAEAASTLGWSSAECDAAYARLEDAGLAPRRSPEAPALPPQPGVLYTTEQYPEFAELVRYAGMRRGKPLSNADTERLLSVFTLLETSAGAVFILISYCCECGRRDWPGIAAIEREAYRWKAAGVTDEASAEAHVRALEQRHSDTGRLARLLQVKGREPTRTERTYLEKWAALGVGDDVVYAAYDKTIVATGKLAWSYMDKVLEAWASEGAPKPKEAEREPTGEPKRRMNAAERAKLLKEREK